MTVDEVGGGFWAFTASTLVEAIRSYFQPVAAIQAWSRTWSQTLSRSFEKDSDEFTLSLEGFPFTSKALLAAVKQNNWRVRADAIRELGAIIAFSHGGARDPISDEIIAIIASALADEFWQVRRSAADALAGLAAITSIAVPELSNALKDQFLLVRIAAADALAKIGPDAYDAIPNLLFALQNDNRWFRSTVARGLERISGSSALTLSALIGMLGKGRSDTRRAAEFLGQMGPAAKEALPALYTALQTENEMMQMILSTAICRIESNSDVTVQPKHLRT